MSFNCKETNANNSDLFTILQIKVTKSSKNVFSEVVGMKSKTQLLWADSHISLRTSSCDTGSKPQSSLLTKE